MPWEGWGTGEAGLSLPRSSWAHPILRRASPLPRGSQASEGLSVGVLVGGQMGPEEGGTGSPFPREVPPGGLVDAAPSQRAAMVPLPPCPHLRRTHVGFSLQHPVLPSSRRPVARSLMKNKSGHGPTPV